MKEALFEMLLFLACVATCVSASSQKLGPPIPIVPGTNYSLVLHYDLAAFGGVLWFSKIHEWKHIKLTSGENHIIWNATMPSHYNGTMRLNYDTIKPLHVSKPSYIYYNGTQYSLLEKGSTLGFLLVVLLLVFFFVIVPLTIIGVFMKLKL